GTGIGRHRLCPCGDRVRHARRGFHPQSGRGGVCNHDPGHAADGAVFRPHPAGLDTGRRGADHRPALADQLFHADECRRLQQGPRLRRIGDQHPPHRRFRAGLRRHRHAVAQKAGALMRSLRNISWLAGKELRTLWRDLLLLVLVLYSFGPGMYVESIAAGETISKTAVAFVDEDNSALSRSLQTALYPPWFLAPRTIEASQIDPMMDWGEVIFAVVVPRGFETDIRSGRPVALQINIDATKTQQAAIGTGYLTAILTQEVQSFAARQDLVSVPAVELVVRRSFNASGNKVGFAAIGGLLNSLSMLTIVLVGAALIREREHGTIEHLLLMPVTAIEIAIAKIVVNGGVILIAFAFSLFIIVEGALGIPFAGSQALLQIGTAIYIFAAGAIGLLLGTLARTMAQFALLIMLVIMPMMILSGGMTPVESQPAWLQPITWLLPSRHYMSFAEAIFYRGAGLDLIWTEFLWTFVLGAATLMLSLIIFRRSVTGG